MAIIMISSDLPEVIGMADRVLVMHEGKLTAEIARSEATEETIMFAATGQTEPIRDGKAKASSNGQS
jgi:rhamnose transport system ATP-binding protein